MAFDFPASPSIDQDYVAGTVTYTYNGTGWVLKGTTTSNFVSKSGDTMTGDLAISKSGPTLRLDKTTVASNCQIVTQTNGVNRWVVGISDSSAESGSDAGSNFFIAARTDLGNAKHVPFRIVRATGVVNLEGVVPSTSPTTGALTVAGGVGIGGALQISGNQTIAKANPAILLNRTASGQDAIIYGLTNGLNRWSVHFAHSGAEGGSNTGSDFWITRYNDAGAYVQRALGIDRSTGIVYVDSITASTSPTTGALVVSGGVGIGGAVNINNSSGPGMTLTGWSEDGSVTGLAGSLRFGGNAAFQGRIHYGHTTGFGVLYIDNTQQSAGADIKFRIATSTTPLAITMKGQDGSLNIASPTSSTSNTTGALVVAGGIGAGGWVNAQLFRPSIGPNASWGFDGSGQGAVLIATNGTYDLAAGSGLLTIIDDGGAVAGLVMFIFGQVQIIHNHNNSLSTVAGTSGRLNIFYSGSAYRLENKVPQTVNLFLGMLKVRPSN